MNKISKVLGVPAVLAVAILSACSDSSLRFSNLVCFLEFLTRVHASRKKCCLAGILNLIL